MAANPVKPVVPLLCYCDPEVATSIAEVHRERLEAHHEAAQADAAFAGKKPRRSDTLEFLLRIGLEGYHKQREGKRRKAS